MGKMFAGINREKLNHQLHRIMPCILIRMSILRGNRNATMPEIIPDHG